MMSDKKITLGADQKALQDAAARFVAIQEYLQGTCIHTPIGSGHDCYLCDAYQMAALGLRALQQGLAAIDTTPMLLLYELKPIGPGNALEAVGAYGFCSEVCRAAFRQRRQQVMVLQEATEATDGMFEADHVCDYCGGAITSTGVSQ